jgi:hypothetical protein
MPVRKHIGYIELIIILCFIVISIRTWTHYSDKAYNKYDNNSCPWCGNKLYCVYYDKVLPNNKIPNVRTYLVADFKETGEGKICMKCYWLSFRCPQCGGKVIKMPPQPVCVQGSVTYMYVRCTKCYWYSILGGGLMEKGNAEDF